jgi:hypothetical protein
MLQLAITLLSSLACTPAQADEPDAVVPEVAVYEYECTVQEPTELELPSEDVIYMLERCNANACEPDRGRVIRQGTTITVTCQVDETLRLVVIGG